MNITPSHDHRAILPVCVADAADQAREALVILSNDVWPRRRGGAEQQAADLTRLGHEVDASTIRRLRSRTTNRVDFGLAVAIDRAAQIVEIERENNRTRRRNAARLRILA